MACNRSHALNRIHLQANTIWPRVLSKVCLSHTDLMGMHAMQRSICTGETPISTQSEVCTLAGYAVDKQMKPLQLPCPCWQMWQRAVTSTLGACAWRRQAGQLSWGGSFHCSLSLLHASCLCSHWSLQGRARHSLARRSMLVTICHAEEV